MLMAQQPLSALENAALAPAFIPARLAHLFSVYDVANVIKHFSNGFGHRHFKSPSDAP